MLVAVKSMKCFTSEWPLALSDEGLDAFQYGLVAVNNNDTVSYFKVAGKEYKFMNLDFMELQKKSVHNPIYSFLNGLLVISQKFLENQCIIASKKRIKCVNKQGQKTNIPLPDEKHLTQFFRELQEFVFEADSIDYYGFLEKDHCYHNFLQKKNSYTATATTGDPKAFVSNPYFKCVKWNHGLVYMNPVFLYELQAVSVTDSAKVLFRTTIRDVALPTVGKRDNEHITANYAFIDWFMPELSNHFKFGIRTSEALLIYYNYDTNMLRVYMRGMRHICIERPLSLDHFRDLKLDFPEAVLLENTHGAVLIPDSQAFFRLQPFHHIASEDSRYCLYNGTDLSLKYFIDNAELITQVSNAFKDNQASSVK